MTEGRFHKVLLAVLACVFLWSAIKPHDYFTWFLEVVPAIVGTSILLATRKKFPFTPLAYCLMAFFMCILMVGGHYTYALVPAGRWVSDATASSSATTSTGSAISSRASYPQSSDASCSFGRAL